MVRQQEHLVLLGVEDGNAAIGRLVETEAVNDEVRTQVCDAAVICPSP